MLKKIIIMVFFLSLFVNSSVSFAGYSYDILMYDLENGKVYCQYCNVTFVKKNGLYGAIDKYGKEVIPAKYGYIEHDIMHKADTIVTVSELGSIGLYDYNDDIPDTKEYKFAFFDLINNKESKPEYDNIAMGLGNDCRNIEVKKNGKYGIIDLDCNILVPLIYDEIEYYSDNEIIVRTNGKSGVIRIDNSICVPIIYDYISSTVEKSLFYAKLDGKNGLIGENNRTVLPIEFDDLRTENGLAYVKKYGKWGVVNLETLTYIMKPTYKYDDIYGYNSSSMSLGSGGRMKNYPIIEDKSVFSDLLITHWAYNSVVSMQEKGKISGFIDGTFRPENHITREQFATMLVNTLNLNNDYKSSFVDIEEDRWSKKYIDIASNYLNIKLVDGKEYFMPLEPAIREDIIVAIVKAMGLENNEYNYSTLNKFSDSNLISENSKKYIAIALENNIIKGNSNGTINPRGNLTRAEIAALMNNIDSDAIMPETVGIMWNEVESLFYENNININVVKQYSDSVKKGIVISQSLPKNYRFNKSENYIEIVVSSGEREIVMNDFSRFYTVEGIQDALRKYEFEYIIIEEKSDEVTEVGRIIRTEPRAGERVETNSKIKIFVSTGYKDKNNIYRESICTSYLKDYSITDTTTVKITITDNSNIEKTVYEGVHTSEDEELSYSVSGYGDIEVKLYLNGKIRQRWPY